MNGEAPFPFQKRREGLSHVAERTHKECGEISMTFRVLWDCLDVLAHGSGRKLKTNGGCRETSHAPMRALDHVSTVLLNFLDRYCTCCHAH